MDRGHGPRRLSSLLSLLRQNRNYRYQWLGQIVSETGDYFNNIAVFALVMEKSGSGLVVSRVMLARAIPAMLAGPLAGVLLDRLDRKQIMIASDLIRAVVAAGFLFTVHQPRPWLLYVLSALLMFASPFFTSGRAAILPSIATADELHAANSLTQTTQWATLTAGTLLAGFSAAALGYHWAFVINFLSFLFSAWAIWRIRVPGGFRVPKDSAQPATHPWRDFRLGIAYMRSVPLLMGSALLQVGWAMGGGAAQILFALFGEQVFHRGAAGIGAIWASAGVGLLVGGAIAHNAGRLTFNTFKRAVTVSYIAHGVAYMLFSQAPSFAAALFFMMLSRVGMAVTTILGTTQILRHTPDQYRGRVFATLESLRWSGMMVSMAATGIVSQHTGPRTIGLVAGAFGTLTALAWAWLDWSGRMTEPELVAEATT